MKQFRKIMIKFMTLLFMSAINTYADTVNTVITNGGDFVKLDNATRMVYAKEIQFKALPNMRFYQFASIKTELGVEPGLTITMMTYDNIKLGGKLTEGTPIVPKSMKNSLTTITVEEQGNAIKFSELLFQSSFDDTLDTATTLLSRDYAVVLDKDLRDAALKGTNVIYGRKDGGAKIASRAEITTANPLTVATIKDAIELLATNNAPKWEGNYYICFIHPHQSRDLRDDKSWIEASKYGAPDQLFTGEIGRIDDVRFIETTNMCNGAAGTDDVGFSADLKKGASGGSAECDVYQATIFGENYYGLAISLPMELRDEPPKDFGREHGIGWYGIWGTDILTKENGIVIETC